MHVTVTGAGGFIGKKLIQQLLSRGLVNRGGKPQAVTRITANDLSLANLPQDPRITRVEADGSDPKVIREIVTDQTDVVYHLAAVVSVGAEEDFELGMRVNLDATRELLDACRRRGKVPFFLFASTAAVYGGEMSPVIEDSQALTPQTSYGTQKAIGELLINDYSRRGFIDGRALRLPTVVVRPGKPNKAASTFCSSIVRDPLEGRDVACPVSIDTKMCLLSPRKVVDAFIRAQGIPARDWGPSRAVQLPGFTVSVREMLASLEQIAGKNVANRVKFEPDERIIKIVNGWPATFRSAKAARLGFSADAGMHDVVQAFIDDELGGKFVA